jgi:hypothetical protein
MKRFDLQSQDQICKKITRDVATMEKCQGYMEKLTTPTSKFEEITDMVNGGVFANMMNCKACMSDTISSLAKLMMADSFEDRNRSNLIQSSITVPDARLFWVQNFGWLKSEVPIDVFAVQYRQYCMQMYGWDQFSAPAEQLMKQVLKSTLGKSLHSALQF